MYTLSIATAPAASASWKLPAAWVAASDDEGNSMVLALMPNGGLADENGNYIGTNADSDYRDLCAAARALVAK